MERPLFPYSLVRKFGQGELTEFFVILIDAGFDARIANILIHNQCRSIEDIVQLKRAQIVRWQGVGKTTAKRIEELVRLNRWDEAFGIVPQPPKILRAANMNLRDYFAAHAPSPPGWFMDQYKAQSGWAFAMWAWHYADNMMTERGPKT